VDESDEKQDGKNLGRAVARVLAERRKSQAEGPRSVSQLAERAGLKRGSVAAVLGGAAKLGAAGVTVEAVAAALDIEPGEVMGEVSP